MMSSARATGKCVGRAGWLWRAAICLVTAAAAGLAAAPLEEYQQRQTTLDKEIAEQHYVLGMWCNEQKLFTEAREQFERALSIDPEHEGAARELGTLTELIRRTKNVMCEFQLVNGDRMKAELLLGTLKVQTPSGFLLIPTAEVDQVELRMRPKPDFVISDGYVGEGHLSAESFSAKSKAGPITVKRLDVTTIRVLRPCGACDGSGQVTCARCGGKGQLNEKSVCPTCKGKGTIRCETCGGKGKITCPLCGGRGTFRGAWGRLRQVRCPRCDGTGKLDCTDCEGKGTIVCPTCKGKPVTTTAGPCPVCNGRKVVPCAACNGTGVRPLPKIEPEPEQKPEPPPDTGEPAKPAEGAQP